MSASKAYFKAVLFDLDGTLLDTAPDFTTATNILLAENDLPQVKEEEIKSLISDGSAGIVCDIFNIDSSDSLFKKKRSDLLALYSKHLTEKTLPFKGIEKLLRMLGEHNVPWGIVTNKPEFYTTAILDELQLKPNPAVVICPDHVKRTKPDPEPILLACKILGVKVEDTVFIGDHIRDIQAGASAGVSTIAAAYGYINKRENTSSWQANFTANRSEDLLELIFCQN